MNMENRNLWAPWRSMYVGGPKEPGCVFCLAAANPDDPERLVVAQGEKTIVLLNRFPYSTGHAMVTPRRHTGIMEELSPEEMTEIWSLALRTKAALTKLYNPDGFNLGINLGQAAGAGITEHLHLHIVPRWVGDSNFMPVLSDVRVMPHHLLDVREKLLAELAG